MRKTYKRLGNYIELVNVRNSDLKDIPLVGLSINKVFIPSIANTIGTNMANYKVIKRNQFAYGPVTSRNGEKITIALFKDYDEALISQAYLPFEIIKPDELLPEYLMMWFSRPEFDRYARYKSHGSARETFDWAEMCEVELPVPSIEKQQKIVSEYQTIENKIKVNEQICEKLEATAQAIYREWFVEFNFPDENGKPYKDNGGKMVWNEEMEKDVPEGWEVRELNNTFDYLFGFPFNSMLFNEDAKGLPLIRIRDILSINSETFTDEDCEHKYLIKKNDLLIGMDGQFHMNIWNKDYGVLNQRVVRYRGNELSTLYLYFSIIDIIKYLQDNIHGTTVAHLSKKDLDSIIILVSDTAKLYSEKTSPIIECIHKIKKENQKSLEVKSLLLARMMKLNR